MDPTRPVQATTRAAPVKIVIYDEPLRVVLIDGDSTVSFFVSAPYQALVIVARWLKLL